MGKFVDKCDDPGVLDVIESLLTLCAEREEEIAKLSKEIQELRSTQATLAASSAAARKKQLAPSDQFGVLVVDPSDLMRSRLVDLLMANGYKVVGEADNGLKAVRLFAEKHPTLVTMDLDMPVMDGYEATRQIKRIDPDAKVIVISQVMNRSMILDALDAGAIDFLTKPVPIDRLLQLMSRVIASMGHGKTRMANR